MVYWIAQAKEETETITLEKSLWKLLPVAEDEHLQHEDVYQQYNARKLWNSCAFVATDSRLWKCEQWRCTGMDDWRWATTADSDTLQIANRDNAMMV